eukprot:TRINITY_DN23_c0_g1_i1.p1 TRINITY_DN23_c0_g1~~TRINITY_DN23_c0_g1_i1.p1  ORF type:complete len:179 (-),score=46.98 TRINITY_DN23_c0_g1_i1:339-836(-)
MAASPELIEKFNKVTSLKYKDQAIFFLNAFWPEHSADAEKVWACCLKMVELDTVKKADGSDLDEFNAHKFLEAQGETLTVIALRERLRKIDLNFDKKMALVEYLLSKFNAPLEELLRRPQGTNEVFDLLCVECGGCEVLTRSSTGPSQGSGSAGGSPGRNCPARG